MYWHGSLDNTRRTVEKIIADRAKGILVITGIGSTPCPLEGLKSTLGSITLNEMLFGPEEELFIDAKGVSMPSPGQAWGTKAFLVDGAQAQPTGDGAFIRRVEELLQPSRRPVRLKVANGEIMGGGTHEATISMEFWEHERLNRPDQAKRSTLSGNFYVADISDWDMIMGYDFMVANAIGALHHRVTLVREDDECLTWLSTDYACGSSQWNAEEEDRIVRAVQGVGAKSRGDRGVQLTEYGMAPQVYDRMIQTLGAEAPGTSSLPGMPRFCGSVGGIGIEETQPGTGIGV